MQEIVKVGSDYIKFIYTTPICNQRPSNDNLDTSGLWQGGLAKLEEFFNKGLDDER